MIQYPCHHCGGLMYLDTVHEGHEVPCPHCDARFVVPIGAVSGQPPGSSDAVDAEWSPSEPDTTEGLQVEATENRRSSPGPRVVRGESMHPVQHAGAASRRAGASPHESRDRRRPAVPRARRDDLPTKVDSGAVALIVGVCAWTFCGLLAPVAWYLGAQARNTAKVMGQPVPAMATIGWLLGMVLTLGALAIVLLAALFAAVA